MERTKRLQLDGEREETSLVVEERARGVEGIEGETRTLSPPCHEDGVPEPVLQEPWGSEVSSKGGRGTTEIPLHSPILQLLVQAAYCILPVASSAS